MQVKSSQGFTLIELLTAIAVLSILASVAVPSYDLLITQSRVRADMQNLLRSTAMARAEAVTRGAEVKVTAVEAEWKKGWRIWTDLNGDGVVDSGETIRMVSDLSKTASIAVSRASAAITEFTFTREGFLDVATAIDIAYKAGSGSSCERERDVRIAPSGQVTVVARDCI